MGNKVCLITGANSGIGFALATGMAKKDFKRFKETPSSKISYDPEIAKRLWRLSEEMTNIKTSTP